MKDRRKSDAWENRVEEKLDRVLESSINNAKDVKSLKEDLKEHTAHDAKVEKRMYYCVGIGGFFILSMHTTEVLAFVGSLIGV